MKWLLTLAITLLVVGVLTPWLRRRGLRRVPGDITIERKGRQYAFPIASTILFSLLASLIFWMLR